VTVDVALEGALGGAPGLSVDGTIELEHLADMSIGRAFGRAGHGTLFRLKADSDEAAAREGSPRQELSQHRPDPRGRPPGDKMVLSDMSAWDAFDRVKLK
jgi:hypothetical protein